MSSSKSLTYFYSPRACTFVGYTAICEAGLSVDLVLAKVGSMTEEFLQINPKGRIPVIVMDGEVITEMAAVLTAISSLVPDRCFLGRTALETIRVYEWLNYLSTVAHNQAFAQIWRPERFTNDTSIYPAIQSKGREVVQEVHTVIEQKLGARGGKNYAVGDSFTVVDPFLVLIYLWSGRIGFDMKERHPFFTAYTEKHLKRDSFIKSAEFHNFK